MPVVAAFLALTLFGASASTAVCELICAAERCHDAVEVAHDATVEHSHHHGAQEGSGPAPSRIASSGVTADCHESVSEPGAALRVEVSDPIDPIAITVETSPPSASGAVRVHLPDITSSPRDLLLVTSQLRI